MLRLIPVVGTLTVIKGHKKLPNGTSVLTVCFVVDNKFYWCSAYGATADYLNNYAEIGTQMFAKEWSLKVNVSGGKTYYDMIISKCEIIK